MKKIIKNFLAIILFILGIICGFLPFLQGWIFVLLGFILIDFKNKHLFEEKILSFINKTKSGKKISEKWIELKKKFMLTDVSLDNSSKKD